MEKLKETERVDVDVESVDSVEEMFKKAALDGKVKTKRVLVSFPVDEEFKTKAIPVIARQIYLMTYAHLVGGWDNDEDCSLIIPERMERIIESFVARGCSREEAIKLIKEWRDCCEPECPPEDCQVMMKMAQEVIEKGEPIELATAGYYSGVHLCLLEKKLVFDVVVENTPMKLNGGGFHSFYTEIAEYYATHPMVHQFEKGPYFGWKMVTKSVTTREMIYMCFCENQTFKICLEKINNI